MGGSRSVLLLVWALVVPAVLELGCGGETAQEAEPAAPTAAKPASPKAPASGEPAAAPAGIPEAAVVEARQIFATRCTTCHGPAGAGDGPGSPGLNPAPRNFQDPEWQASVGDDHIETIIQYGGAAVGRSPAMPANPDLTSKPDVVRALREYVRSLNASG